MEIEPSHWISTGPQTISITERAALEDTPDVAFELDTAPDGLPLAMFVRRAIDVQQAVINALGSHYDKLPKDLQASIDQLTRGARAFSVARGIVRQQGALYYETSGSIASLLGHTLFARMIGATSPTVLPEDRRANAPARFENTGLVSLAELRSVAHHATPAATTGRNSSIHVSLGKERVVKVGDRILRFESLLALRSARWHAWTEHGATSEGRLADERAYIKALRNARRMAWSVSRHDVITLVAELARSVDRDWHAKRRVHGDLKPGNVLLDEKAIVAFDALDVPTGELCAGVTEGWAAPEQITVRPVTPASDVYALGLMAAAALGGAIFGEESTMVVPAAGDGRRRLRLFKDPDVWLDPKVVELDREARLAWRDLLVPCLAYDPERRPPNGGVLAERMHALLGRWEVPGRLAVECGPGSLELTISGKDPLWVLRDSR